MADTVLVSNQNMVVTVHEGPGPRSGEPMYVLCQANVRRVY